jgi:hypothetical protein
MIKMREAWGTLRVASASEINSLGHRTGWQNFSDAIVRGAHPSKTAKGEAAKIVVGQRWASPLTG